MAMQTQPAQSNNEGNGPGAQDDAVRRYEPRQKHGILKTIIITAAILAIGIGLVGWWLNSRKFEGTDDAYVAGHIHAMSFRVSGTISEVLIDDNELVKVEQRIAKLDPRDFEVQLNQARANLEIARARLEQADAQLAQADAQLQ